MLLAVSLCSYKHIIETIDNYDYLYYQQLRVTKLRAKHPFIKDSAQEDDVASVTNSFRV